MDSIDERKGMAWQRGRHSTKRNDGTMLGRPWAVMRDNSSEESGQ
jgi:hypothetical protein